MDWRLDRSSKEPLFRQIARLLEEQIVNGTLPAGTMLMPERKLARKLGVNRSTVVAAYGELRAAGLVESKQGSGTWVNDELWGMSLKRLPNWQQYTNGGSFLPTFPLTQRIQAAGRRDSVINLASGEPSAELMPLEPIQRLLQTISLEHSPGHLGYPDAKGDGHLRETLAYHLVKNRGIVAHPEQILITSGAQQALHLITQCLLRPGDAVALEGPSYAYSLPLFISAGLRLFPLPLDEQGLLPDEVRTLYQKHKIRMVFTNPTYQNPTGTTLSEVRRKQLLSICEELRIPLVEDDVYGSLTLHGAAQPPRPLIAYDKGGGSVIYIGSLSKTAAPGLRIGWVVGPRSVIERLADAKRQIDFGISPVLSALASAYLSSCLWQEQVEKLRTALTFRRDLLIAALEKHAADLMSWNIPSGGYHIWCRLAHKYDETALLEAGIQNGVLVMPGKIFGAKTGYVRLSFARVGEKELEEGVRLFAKTIADMAG